MASADDACAIRVGETWGATRGSPEKMVDRWALGEGEASEAQDVTWSRSYC